MPTVVTVLAGGEKPGSCGEIEAPSIQPSRMTLGHYPVATERAGNFGELWIIPFR